MKKLLFFIMAVYLPSQLFSQASVGGHVKVGAFDLSHGEHSGKSGRLYSGMTFNEFVLYISGEISDMIYVDLQPYVDTQTGATPKLDGSTSASPDALPSLKWHKTTDPDNAGPEFRGFRKAVVTLMLPGDYELSAGIVKPRFTWDYGAELFWEEEFHGGKFTNDLFLGSMHDTGFEIYKPFEIGSLSMPAYFYLLNGGHEYSDNNGSAAGMMRLEPEWGAFRLGLSLCYGLYDDRDEYSFQRYAAGLQYTAGNLEIRSEASQGIYEKALGADDAEAFGYYAKLLYRVHPRLRCMFHYDFVDHNFGSLTWLAPGAGLEYVTYTPGFQWFLTETALIQVQYDIGRWKVKDDSDTLDFGRLTIGLRATF